MEKGPAFAKASADGSAARLGKENPSQPPAPACKRGLNLRDEGRIMPLTLKETAFRSDRNRCGNAGFLGDPAIIEARTELLDPEDKNLLRAVLIYNQPTKVVAEINRTRPSSVRYRVRRLIERIGSPQFVGTARSLGLFNAEQTAVARCHILQGKTLQATVATTGLPYHTVRRVLCEINGIIDGLRKSREPSPPPPHQEHVR